MHNSEWPLGQELHEKRSRAKLSQRAAADLAGFSESKWRQLESGHVSAGAGQRIRAGTTAQTVAAAARAVGLDVAHALTLAGFDPAQYPLLVNAAADPVDDTIPGVSRLTPRQRAAVIALVESILEVDDEPYGVHPGKAPRDIAERGVVLSRRPDESDRTEPGSATGN